MIVHKPNGECRVKFSREFGMNIKWSKVRKIIKRAAVPLVHSKVIKTDGIRFKIHPGDNKTERAIWLKGRLPEKQSLDALAAVVSGKRALFFDIGANCGIYSVFIGKATQKFWPLNQIRSCGNA